MKNRALLAAMAGTTALTLGGVACYFVSAAPHAAAQTTPAVPVKPAAARSAVLLPATGTLDVTDAATAFLATLTAKQKAVVQNELKADVAARWSNFPVTFVPRNGVFFRDLNAQQVAAALKVARLALGEEGFKRFQEIRAADEYLGKVERTGGGGPGGGPGGPGGFGGPPPGGLGGPGGQGGPPGGGPGGGNEYSAKNYMIAFLGKPSKTTPWGLQLGGHHLAFNLTYKGKAGAATPYFIGTEPTAWKDANGKMHEPMKPMRDAVYGLVNSLTPEQQAQAKLSVRFGDVYVGPGRDGHFPTKSEGVPVSQLSDASKTWVKKALAAWTGDNAQSAQYRKLYESELNQTRIAYSGTTTLNNRGDYVRIDGPHAWVEFSCQGGIVIRNQIHYHTIWRDRVTDYGAEFSY